VSPERGESLARKFAAEGCQVPVFARSADHIEELAADLPDPGEWLAVRTHLTDVQGLEAAARISRPRPVETLPA
jgi:NADP-dependent 3-hydroxy acid dehydrogenase YdfG